VQEAESKQWHRFPWGRNSATTRAHNSRTSWLEISQWLVGQDFMLCPV